MHNILPGEQPTGKVCSSIKKSAACCVLWDIVWNPSANKRSAALNVKLRHRNPYTYRVQCMQTCNFFSCSSSKKLHIGHHKNAIKSFVWNVWAIQSYSSMQVFLLQFVRLLSQPPPPLPSPLSTLARIPAMNRPAYDKEWKTIAKLKSKLGSNCNWR